MAFDLDDEELEYNRKHPLGIFYRQNKPKTIVLCGSRYVKKHILDIEHKLTIMGYNVLIPDEIVQDIDKSDAIKLHFDKICYTDIILVVNTVSQDLGIDNYICPNTFAEIMFAFYKDKPIYLLEDYYDYYIDELMACNVKCLKGNLNNLY